MTSLAFLILGLSCVAALALAASWLDARLHAARVAALTAQAAQLAAEVEAGEAVAELVQWRSIFAGVAQDLMADAQAAVERAEWFR